MLGVCLLGITLRAAETNEVKTAANEADSGRKDRIAQMASFIKKCGLEYEIKDGSDFIRVEFSFPCGRSQIVYVDSEVYDYGGYKTIHIGSPAYRGQVTKAMLMDLLTQNPKVGFWHAGINQQNEYDLQVEFAVQIPADIMPEDFKTLCDLTASEADRMEARWTDRDDF